MTIGLAIFIGIIVGIIIALVIFYFSTKAHNSELDKDFLQSQNRVMKDLQKKKDDFDKELTQEQLIQREKLRQALEELNNDYDKQRQSYKERTAQLDVDYQKRREEIKELEAAAENERINEQAEKIQAERDRDNNELNSLSSEYKEKKEQLDQDFLAFSEQVSTKREALTKEIQDYENKQKEIIARFKEDEEKRQQADFYRICLSEQDQEDIKKLKTVAESLNSPTVLYKLIWENYYKTPYSEMVGRVVPKDKKGIGIYKITNIENGKVYIGQTRQDFNVRWRSHVKRGLKAEPTTNNKLYSEMWRLGPEHFTFEVLTTCPVDKLNEQEKYYIQFYDSQNWGYNSNSGVGS